MSSDRTPHAGGHREDGVFEQSTTNWWRGDWSRGFLDEVGESAANRSLGDWGSVPGRTPRD